MNQNYTSNNNSSVSKVTAFARLKEHQRLRGRAEKKFKMEGKYF